MKALVIFFASILSFNLYATSPNDASPRLPLLLEKVVHTGYVPDGMEYSLSCKIFADKVVVHYTKMRLVKDIAFTVPVANEVFALIDKAALGKITSHPAPADIGDSIYTAVQVQPNDGLKEIDLGTVLDSRKITKNSSAEAEQLKKYLDETCDLVLKK